MKMNEKIFEAIKLGEPVETHFIPGHISGPVEPEEIFDVEYSTNGEVFKKTINPNKWIFWLKKVSIMNASTKTDIADKSIMDCGFYSKCKSALQDIENYEQEINGKLRSGVKWLVGGTPYSIPLSNKQIARATEALQMAIDTSIQPIPSNYRIINEDRIINEERLDEYRNALGMN